eukprot:jgi/Astpho2/7187/Aster-01505
MPDVLNDAFGKLHLDQRDPEVAEQPAIGWPLQHAELGADLGVDWPRGLLLHGPPGCGKTLAARFVAEECGARLHSISAAQIFGAYTGKRKTLCPPAGESERRLREAFEGAEAEARRGQPVVIFLDEIDAMCPRRDAGRQHEAHLGGRLTIIAATNRPNAIDPALRRPGRLDREVLIPVPGPQERTAILRLQAAGLPLDSSVDLPGLAVACHGYSGADLAALCRQAAMVALTEAASALLSGEQLEAALDPDLARPVSQVDFEAAMKKVGPSITRGSEVEVSPVLWEDIGGLPEVKQRLKQAVQWPLEHASSFERLGLSPPRGVLLHGPPGCSKTTLARAAATASRASLFPLSSAQLFSMYVGEGESLLRATFRLARAAAPSIIFLDEVDSLAGSRAEGDSGSGATAGVRLLSALLTEMDGLELATGVQVIAATNRPGAIDAALLRPGRLEMLLFVPPPDAAGRLQVLEIHTRSMPLAPDAWAAATDLFTGAELAALCREASMAALREDIHGAQHVAARHFAQSRAAIQPGLTAAALQKMAAWSPAGS